MYKTRTVWTNSCEGYSGRSNTVAIVAIAAKIATHGGEFSLSAST